MEQKIIPVYFVAVKVLLTGEDSTLTEDLSHEVPINEPNELATIRTSSSISYSGQTRVKGSCPTL